MYLVRINRTVSRYYKVEYIILIVIIIYVSK